MVLDGRQYRSDQPNNDVRSPLNEAALNPETTMLGKDQRNWLKQSLIQSRGTWNILAQQVMMGMVGTPSGDVPMAYSMDQWPGYTHERMDIFDSWPTQNFQPGRTHRRYSFELGQRAANRRPQDGRPGGGCGICRHINFQRWRWTGPHCLTRQATLGQSLHQVSQPPTRLLCCKVTQKTWTTDYMVADKVTTPGGKMTSALLSS